MWRPTIPQGQLVPGGHLPPCIAQATFHLWVQVDVDLLTSSCTNQCQCYYTIESPLPLGALGLNAFNYPWTYQVSYIFLATALVPLVLSFWENISQTNSDLFYWHLVGWRLLGFPQFSTCWKMFFACFPL